MTPPLMTLGASAKEECPGTHHVLLTKRPLCPPEEFPAKRVQIFTHAVEGSSSNPSSGASPELYINPDVFPTVKVGDILLLQQESSSKQPVGFPLLLQVSTLEKQRGIPNLSIRADVAEFFKFQSRSTVCVTTVDPQEVVLDFVELSFKDQFISRSNMFRFILWLRNKCAYQSQNLEWSGMRVQVEEMMTGGKPTHCGFIGKSTRITFRSRSANFYFLFQMSREMWQYTMDGDIRFEKAVDGFFKEVFTRWTSFFASHRMTIIFFSRTYFDGDPSVLYLSFRSRRFCCRICCASPPPFSSRDPTRG